MIKRRAPLEMMRLGENAPSTSWKKPTRPPAAGTLAAMLPAPGFMVVTVGFLFLARENDFYAPVLRAAYRGGVRSQRLGVAVGMNAETAVRKVGRSFSLQPV